MNQILPCDWLPECARWSDTARSGLPCFVPAITFRRSQAGAQNIFRESEKIFCDFSVGVELEKEKTETPHAYNWLPFQCSKINKYEDNFFSVLYAIY